MKNLNKFSLTALFLLFSCFFANAYSFQSEGLYFKKGTGNNVSVTYFNYESATAYTAPHYTNPYFGEIVIPETVKYEGATYNVVSIDEGAFNNSDIESITIPSSITSIGKGAFSFCSKLIQVIIEDSTNELIIYSGIHYKSYSSGIGGTSYAEDPYEPFVDSPLEYIYIGRELSFGKNYSGGNYGLRNNTLKKVEFGDNVTKILNQTFYNCINLTEISFPAKLTTIENAAFSGCTNLKSITLPNKIESIGGNAFSTCVNLEMIKIPSSLKTFGNYAFANHSNLKDFYNFSKTPQSITANVFNGTTISNVTLHVPFGSKEAYLAASIWQDFNIEDDIDENLYYELTIFNGNSTQIVTSSIDDASASNALVFAKTEVEKNIFENSEKNIVCKGKADVITLTDAQPFYCPENIYVESLTYSRNFSNTNFQPLYVPFSMKFDDWSEIADVYRINAYYESDTDGDGVVDKKELGLIKVKEAHGYLYPNHPYIIKPKTASGWVDFNLENVTLYATEENNIDCSTVDTRYVFTGTYQSKKNMLRDGCYFLSGNMICYALNDDTELKGFRWFMNIESRGGQFINPPAKIGLRIEDGATEIEEIIDLDQIEDCRVFNLNGSVVNPTSAGKGLYIKNGKKIYIK